MKQTNVLRNRIDYCTETVIVLTQKGNSWLFYVSGLYFITNELTCWSPDGRWCESGTESTCLSFKLKPLVYCWRKNTRKMILAKRSVTSVYFKILHCQHSRDFRICVYFSFCRKISLQWKLHFGAAFIHYFVSLLHCRVSFKNFVKY